jgi:hypothetical protein
MFVFVLNVAQNVHRLFHRESRSLRQLKIGKVLMDLNIFLIIKLMLTYVNVNVHDNRLMLTYVNVNVHDNCFLCPTPVLQYAA